MEKTLSIQDMHPLKGMLRKLVLRLSKLFGFQFLR